MKGVYRGSTRVHKYSGLLTGLMVRHRQRFDNAPIGFHVIRGRQGVIKEVNQRWLDLLGYNREEVINRSIFDFVVDSQAARESYQAKLAGREVPAKIEPRQYRRKDGSTIFVETHDAILKDARGRTKEICTSFQDVTARVLAEREVKAKHAELLAAQEALIAQARKAAIGDFAAATYHTTKNLFQALLANQARLEALFHQLTGALETAANCAESGERLSLAQRMGFEEVAGDMKRQLDRSNQITKELAEMTAQILSFSRVRSEMRKPIPVVERLRELVELFSGRESGGRVQIYLESRLERERFVFAAETRFWDMISCLIDNAIDACKERARQGYQGKVRVKVEETVDGQLKISVIDNGKGIEGERIAQMLKGPVATTKKHGTGLGLWTVQMNATSEGGRVDIRSFVGAGTTVAVRLPISQKVGEGPAQAEAVKLEIDWQKAKQLPVLLVDDYETLLELNAIVVSRLGFPVETCPSAEAALVAVRQQPGKFRILITDENMPGDQGHQLIEKVVSLTGEKHPYFVLTSGADREGTSQEIDSVLTAYRVRYVSKGTAATEFLEKVLGEILLEEQSRS